MTRNDHVVVVGSGFGGIGMAIRLKKAGIDDFTIFEQAERIGGTWRDNAYPGAACDIESHLYSFSFEPNPEWSRTYAPQREILEYLERCVDRYGLRPHLRLGVGVTRATFDERAGLWDIETSDGASRRARAVVAACGGLSRPALPDIPGLDTFEGPAFHSARWDRDAALDGKRVAIVGTGASAIQIVPELARRAARLDVYQRTPPWILPKEDRAITDRERARYRARPWLQRLVRRALYARHEVQALGFVVEPRILGLASRMATKHLEASVPDAALRQKLTPRYAMGCKRVLLSNDYYPAIQRDNVELVTDSIRAITPRGIVAVDGREREVDALVLATGFHAADALAPFETRGQGGRVLDDAWRSGAEAFLGAAVAGFPNLFMIVGPNTGLGHNSMITMIESQLAYVLDAIQMVRRRGLTSVAVRADAQERYNARLQGRLARTVWATGCNAWYSTKDGKNTTLWPGFTFEFRVRTRRIDPADYHVVP